MSQQVSLLNPTGQRALASSAMLVFTVFIVGFLAGCAPQARIRDPNEASLVGTKRAGAAVYRNVIDQALNDLSSQYRAQQANVAQFNKVRVAFMGVDNRTNEELGAWRDQINDIVNIGINGSNDFMDISFENLVKPALSEIRVSPRQLVLPKYQRQLAEVLEQSGNTIDALIFASLTQGETRANDLKQSDYLLTMELVPITKEGAQQRRILAKGELSKEYSR